jgi:hypothetical protein
LSLFVATNIATSLTIAPANATATKSVAMVLGYHVSIVIALQ